MLIAERLRWTLLLAALVCAGNAAAQTRAADKCGADCRLPAKTADGADLPNGWRITPAGKPIATLGDLVTNAVISPDGKWLVTVNSGFIPHGIDLFDAATGEHVQHIGLPSAFLGLVWSPDGKKLFVAGGNANGIKNTAPEKAGGAATGSGGTVGRDLVADGTITPDPVAPVYEFAFANGRLSREPAGRFLETNQPRDVWWSGLAFLPAQHRLYAVNRGTKDAPGSVVVFDTGSRRIVTRIAVEKTPYQAILTRDGKRLFVSNWSDNSISVIDTGSNRVIGRVAVGANPNDLKLSADGRLFVACSNDNTVRTIDIKTLKLAETISTTLTPLAPEGSTPDALAIDDARHLLYVANADNNSLAVVDIRNRARSQVAGFIPTGWYPSALALGNRGKTLFIGNAKGEEGHPDPLGPHSPLTEADKPFSESGNGSAGISNASGIFSMGKGSIHTLQKSSLEMLPLANLKARLPQWTREVMENTPYHDSLLSEAQPPREPSVIPREVGVTGPIKHIIYIIKENRTYDQVFGDLPNANGDPRLAIFGETVTPNQHALAKEYVTLDNLYADGEVSADGHQWSTAAYATDFMEKQWPSLYGGISKGTYDVPAAVPQGGYLWDAALRHGLTFRDYGEMVAAKKTPAGTISVPAPYREGLAGHVAPDFRTGFGQRETDKVQVFLREFRQYEANYDSPDPAKRLPNLIVMSMGQDHTQGTLIGAFTPEAYVANNDYAIGQLVDAVSHSRYWPETAIFIIEDDAQDGSDHVDARRTVGLVISPYVKRGVTDSTLYSTSSMLHSMELLLGLPPMSQYDAAAMPMYASFGATPVVTPFTAIAPMIDTNARNTKTAYGAERSGRMDFSDVDRAPMHALNEIIWKSIKGADSEMPAPVHRFRPLMEMAGDDDDGDDRPPVPAAKGRKQTVR